MSPPYNSDALIKVHHSNSELYETKASKHKLEKTEKKIILLNSV